MPPYAGEPNMQDPSKRPKWEEAYKALHAPERIDVQTEDTKVRGQLGPGREQTSPVRTAPERQPSTAPYFEVYEAYAQEAEEALAREDIPRPYQRQVRDYFRSIQPDRGD
ncbi:MAG: hypothetical protein FJX74_06290 [Armatimonadetes bacterium]|nr:hypothetical protein [Armatimonadota bacterium]